MSINSILYTSVTMLCVTDDFFYSLNDFTKALTVSFPQVCSTFSLRFTRFDLVDKASRTRSSDAMESSNLCSTSLYSDTVRLKPSGFFFCLFKILLASVYLIFTFLDSAFCSYDFLASSYLDVNLAALVSSTGA